MSLVSDALKKAQRDAALREGREKGLPERLVAPDQPWRARRAGGARHLGYALGVVAVLALGSVAWLLLARPEAGPGGGGASAPAPPPAADSGPAPSRAAKAPERGDAVESTPNESREGSAAAEGASTAPAAAPTSVTPSLESNGVPGDPLGPRAAPAPPLPAPKAQPGDGADRAFVREARLDDGVELRLGGIAWSETAPLAYLNGRLVGVGESVSGWRIERIERGRVRLVGAGGRIAISLR